MYFAATDSPKPAVIPTKAPANKPRQVLPSPRTLFPSFQVLPKSIGVPPPTRSALALATYAGTIIQRA